jgi:hypothetical protein
MLDAISQLPQDRFRHIERILRDEIDAHAFGADQSHHLHDFILDDFWQIREQQVRFIKKEDQFWFFRITHFRQPFKQCSQQPQQKRGIDLG